jgi:hypothetical protein
MLDRTRDWILDQIKCHRGNQATAPVLPFQEELAPEVVHGILDEIGYSFRQRIYTPMVTLSVFLWQMINDGRGCVKAVLQLKAHLLATGQRPCSPDTAPYCQARKRLPEALFQRLVQKTGRRLQESAPEEWSFHGRRVKSVDGTTVSMPDTPENQKEYPQPRSQKPGVGFPLARLVVIFCVATGAVLEAAVGPYRGKLTGETMLFRSLWDSLETGDIVLADRYYCSFADIALLRTRGVDVVYRKHQNRLSDFRRGKRLGKYDHLVTWQKPKHRPSTIDEQTFAALPPEIVLREIKFQIVEKGRRTKEIILITTLVDAEVDTPKELARLYNIRWQAEIDLRSLKSVMEMDVLRCKSPDMVRKEIWTHMLAYNLIRTVMARAAEEHGRPPHTISFKGAMQAVESFRTYLLMDLTSDWYMTLLDTIAYHEVGNRPGRYEPRARKRRPKPYKLLQIPRDQARKRSPGKTYD